MLLYYLDKPNSSYIVHPALYDYEEITSVLKLFKKVASNEIKNNIDTESIKSSWNQVKDDFQKGMDISKGRSISTPNPQKVQTTKTNSQATHLWLRSF